MKWTSSHCFAAAPDEEIAALVRAQRRCEVGGARDQHGAVRQAAADDARHRGVIVVGPEVSRYRSTIDGLSIVYELLSDSLVLKQTLSGKRRVLYELKECMDNPDRGTLLVYDVTDIGVLQHWATFKRCSNGTPLFTLFSARGEPSDPFEVFVADLIAAIKRQRVASPRSPETGITPAASRRDGPGFGMQGMRALLRTGEWGDSVFGHGAWSCVCHLWSDRLLLQRTHGAESTSAWMEFRYCNSSPTPVVRARGYWIRRKVMFRHIADGRPYFGLATASDFADAIDFVVARRQAEKWQANPAEPSGDEFQRFVAATIAAIKRTRDNDPGLAQSIRVEPT